jgi:hypothetical protein
MKLPEPLRLWELDHRIGETGVRGRVGAEPCEPEHLGLTGLQPTGIIAAWCVTTESLRSS